MTFTERLTELLDEHNISRRQLSIESGIPNTTINNWFNRSSLPTLDIVERLADYFQCSIDYLSGRENYEGNIIINNASTYSIPNELILVYQELDSMHKNILLGIAKNVLKAQKEGA